MSHPDTKGGRNYLISDLLARDGKYDFVVTNNGKVHSAFSMSIAQGKPVLHPRQAGNYQPRTEYIVPRYAGLASGRDQAGNTVWMSRLPDAEARSIASGRPADASGPTAEQKERWDWKPAADPEREFRLVTTAVQTRTDTHIAAGDDLIAFGTGFPTGVSYLKVGEEEAREIPNGELYNSRLFWVCGRRIVLLHKNQVVIYDTDSGRTTAIPENEVTLYNPVGGLHNGNQMIADGYLVAVVNRADAVVDGNIIKVIDLSGAAPVVIPIRNAGYTDRQVSSVAVEARTGMIAVSSSEKKLISVATVAPLANQMTFDVSEYRGVDRRQIYLDNGSVVYADEDLKIRQLRPDAPVPAAITQEPIGRSGNGFVVRNGRLVIATPEHIGSRFKIAVSDLKTLPLTTKDTGTEIEGTSGALGMAGCAAIAADGTVFIAGTPGGGIGVGEHLQVLDRAGGHWTPLRNSSNDVISAIDVTTSTGLLAFKASGQDRSTTVGYATYGQRITPPSIGATASSKMNPSGSSVKTRPLTLADDNPFYTSDEAMMVTLKAFLDTEKQVGEAYVAAFGREAGERKTVETIQQSIKASGNEALIDDYLRMSAYVPNDEKPGAGTESPSESRIETAAVAAALQGEWQAIRYSMAGQNAPDSVLDAVSLTFVDGRYVLTMPGEPQTGTFEIDSSTTPIAITVHIGNGANKGQFRRGSLKLLTGNRLLLVFATDEGPRPTTFVPDSSGKSFLAAYQKK